MSSEDDAIVVFERNMNDKQRALDLHLQGRSIQGIAQTLHHAQGTIRSWLDELIAEVSAAPDYVSRREINRELGRRRLDHLKAEAWKKVESMFYPEDSEKAGQPRSRGGYLAAARFMEIILRAEEHQARLEGLVGSGTHDAVDSGKTTVKRVEWIVRGPGETRAGVVVETTGVLRDEGQALGPGGGNRVGEEPRGSDAGHRLQPEVHAVAGSDPGTDGGQPQGHDDAQVLRAPPGGSAEAVQQERPAPDLQPPDADDLGSQQPDGTGGRE